MCSFNVIVIQFTLALSFIPLSTAAHQKCMYIDYRGKTASHNTDKCAESEICSKHFKITYISLPPYSTARLLESILRKCCGKCTNFTVINAFVNITQLSLSEVNSSDFIVPLLGGWSAVTLYGYHFVPLINIPNGFYITPKHPSMFRQIIIDSVKLWPLLVVSLLMAMVSGFIVWAVESWTGNDVDYSQSFLQGFFDGIWFSFISMTTVGYGDKTVKSVPAKLFAGLWILIGITMFCLLTASLTTAILKAVERHEDSMVGCRVGALKYRDYDASLIVDQGGIVVESSAWNFYTDVLGLVRMLREKEIHGFFLDKYTMIYVKEYFEWKLKGNTDSYVTRNNSESAENDEHRLDIDFFLNHTHRSYKRYEGARLSYGVLVKSNEDYHYFRDAIRDNRLPLDNQVGSEMNEHFRYHKQEGLFSTSGVFWMVIVVLGVALAFIFLFGVFYEVKIRKRRKKNLNSTKQMKSDIDKWYIL